VSRARSVPFRWRNRGRRKGPARRGRRRLLHQKDFFSLSLSVLFFFFCSSLEERKKESKKERERERESCVARIKLGPHRCVWIRILFYIYIYIKNGSPVPLSFGKQRRGCSSFDSKSSLLLDWVGERTLTKEDVCARCSNRSEDPHKTTTTRATGTPSPFRLAFFFFFF